MLYDYLIIGGGIAGTTAAETIRQQDKEGSVAILSGEPFFLYSRVLLPEFIRGEVGIEKVMLRSEADYKKNGIDIFLGESVESFDPEKIILKTDKSREFQAKKVLISSGGKPKPWRFDKASPWYRLQTLDDATRLKNFLEKNPHGKALVVGGGFMALEFIEILKHYGWKITLLCKEPRFWPDFLDERGSEILADLWLQNGIELIFSDQVAELRGQNGQHGVLTRKREELGADIVCVGIGLERNLDCLEVKPPSGGLTVNECLETEFPNVWSAGDVAVYPDPFSWRMRASGNWSGAFMQGRIAGLNMVGGKERFKTISAYAISHFGTSVAFVGDVGPFEKDFGAKSKIIHFDKEKKEYARIFEKDGKTIGAALINGQRFMGSINRAIMEKWDAIKIILE